MFIELLQDIADKPLVYDVYKQGTPTAPASDLGVLEEALQEVVDWIGGSTSPVILAGVHIARYGLGTDLLKFAEKYNIPIVTTLLSKSVINEIHPLSKGVYIGSGSQPQVLKIINESDCVITLGISPGGLDFAPIKQAIVCSSEILRVKNHHYTNVGFEEFTRHLFKAIIRRDKLVVEMTNDRLAEFRPKNSKITIARFFEKINSILNEDCAVIADAGDALMGASDLVVHHQNHFFATTSHPNMGFAIPAALGVQVAAPKVRPIVIVGDTAFQVSCVELSTIVDRRLNPIIFVLNNGGYAIDTVNGPFHDIHEWEYEKMMDVLTGGVGVVVEDEQSLHSVVSMALKATQPYVVNVKIDASDISPALQRMRKEKAK